MKVLIIICLSIVCTLNICFSQICASISDLYIGSVKIVGKGHEVYMEGRIIDTVYDIISSAPNEPYIIIKVNVKNNSKVVQNVYIVPDEFMLKYRYQGHDYTMSMNGLRNPQEIGPNQQTQVELNLDSPFRTAIFKPDKREYIMEILEILPTIKIKFNVANYINIDSKSITSYSFTINEIGSISLNWQNYIYP